MTEEEKALSLICSEEGKTEAYYSEIAGKRLSGQISKLDQKGLIYRKKSSAHRKPLLMYPTWAGKQMNASPVKGVGRRRRTKIRISFIKAIVYTLQGKPIYGRKER